MSRARTMSCTLGRSARKAAPSGLRPRFLRLWAMRRLVLFLSFLCASDPSARAQDEPLSVRFADGRALSLAVHVLGAERYVSMSDVNEILRAVDSSATAQWNASTGVYRAQAGGHDFSLYERQAILLCNNAILETRLPLVAARGQVFVPLDSVGRILKYLDGTSANIPLSHAPAASPTPKAASRAHRTANLANAAAGTEDGVVPADFSASADRLVKGTVGAKGSRANPAQSLRQAADRLGSRRTLVIDPEPPDLPSLDSSAQDPDRADGGAGADLTLRVALRCRELLSANPSVRVVLTRDAPGAKPSPEARIQIVNASEPMALVCLRVDASRFKAPGGYRLYAPHRAADPSAPDAAAIETAGLPLPIEAAYVPYEAATLLLARFVDEEMTRGGLVRAPAALQLAPFYLLKRASSPSLSVSLGYATNDADRDRFADPAYVEAAAASLAQGILQFARWLDRNLLEMP